MTTTWSFWFFIIMTTIAFALAPVILGIALVLIALVIIGRICRWNIERREARRGADRAPVLQG